MSTFITDHFLLNLVSRANKLVYLSCVGLLIFVGVLSFWSWPSAKHHSHHSCKVPHNEQTLTAHSALQRYLNILSNSIDHSVDPCDNFYSYVCGHCERSFDEFELPADNILSHLYQTSKKTIIKAFHSRERIENGIEAQAQSVSAVQLVVDLFRRCIDEPAEHKFGFISNYLQQEQQTEEEHFHDPNHYDHYVNVTTTGAHWMQHYVRWWLVGVMPVFSVTVVSDRNQSDGTPVNRFQLSITEYNYLSEPSKCRARMLSMINRLPLSSARYLRDHIEAMVRLEGLIGAHYHDYYNQKHSSSNPPVTHRFRLSTLRKHTGGTVDWTQLLNLIVSSTHTTSPLQLTDHDLVLVSDLPFFTWLAVHVLQSDNSVLGHYMQWYFVYSVLHTTIDDGDMDQSDEVHDRTTSSDTHWGCIESLINDEHALVISRLYLDQIGGPEPTRLRAIKQRATELVQQVRMAFRNILAHEVDWLDGTTRRYALQKLGTMLHLVAYPELALNDTALDLMYGLHPDQASPERLDLHKYVNTRSYYHAKIEVHLQRATNLISRFQDHPDLSLPWHVNPASFGNCKYIRNRNAILIPMAMLQPPLFDLSYPSVINLAVAGFFIGHEMTHGFDREGCRYDMLGGQVINWCSSQVQDHFGQRAQCLARQYGSLVEPITGKKMDGELSLSENIADNAGLREAFFAFRKHLKEASPEERQHLDQLSMHFSPDQLFFINFAKPLNEDYMRKIMDKGYSPPIYRVNVPLSNLEQFGEAFDCPLGSMMNPVEKCVLW